MMDLVKAEVSWDVQKGFIAWPERAQGACVWAKNARPPVAGEVREGEIQEIEKKNGKGWLRVFHPKKKISEAPPKSGTY